MPNCRKKQSLFLGEKQDSVTMLVSWYRKDDPVYHNYGCPIDGIWYRWGATIPWPQPIGEHEFPMRLVEKCYGEIPDKHNIVHRSNISLINRRRITPEGKASIRKKNLRKRLEKSDPLFVNELYDRKLNENPDYFDPAAIAEAGRVHDIEMREMMAQRDRRFAEVSICSLGYPPGEYLSRYDAWIKTVAVPCFY